MCSLLNSVSAFLLTLFACVNSANILGIFLVPSISHQKIFQSVYKELALRGHNLTVITPDPLKDPRIPNLIEIDLHDVSYAVWDRHNISKLGVNEEIDSSDMTPFINLLIELMDGQMSVPEFKNIIHQDLNHFDLLLGETMLPTVYPFIDLCNCAMVGISSLPVHTIMHNLIGNPAHPVVSPDINLPFSRNLNFWERLQSVIYYIALQFLYQKVQEPMERVIHKHFGPNTRDIITLMAEVDLLLANVNPVLMPPRPNIPAIVDFYGVHIQPPKPLPKDIETFLDNAIHGAVYISFGSNIQSHYFPKEKIDIFLDVISNMPYNFIWKFESRDIPSQPSNLFLSKWLPQQDILRHNNTKLFVTQGGLQSWEEALFAKVPVVIIPFFGDQHGNARKIEELGMGLKLKFQEVTMEKLQSTIYSVIKNDTYKATTKKLYDIATDQPMTGLEKAIWWIEYTIRHNGAKHLRSPAFGMPAYQYYMLDVAAFLIGTTITALILTFVLFKLLYKIIAVNIIPKIKGD